MTESEKHLTKLKSLLTKLVLTSNTTVSERCEIMRANRTKRTYRCANCGKSFEAYATVRPNNQRTCSSRCRTKLYLNRKKFNEETNG